jgi:vacuolar-type H+-ATPase subunit H
MSSYGVREATGTSQWITGSVTRNPESLLLLAAGVALLMRSGRGPSVRRSSFPERRNEGQYRARREDSASGVSERIGEATRLAGEYVSGATERAGEYVSETTDKMSETARSYASSASEYADEAARIAADRSRRMANQVRDTADYLVREQPWAIALTGLLAGAAVAAAFPSARLERRTLGEVGERLRSAAGTMGQRVMEAGMQAGERLSEVAEERGLTAEGLKQAARDVGGTFSSALAGEESSTQSRRQAGKEAGSTTQRRQEQSGTRSAQANKSGPTRSSGPTPSGGGR